MNKFKSNFKWKGWHQLCIQDTKNKIMTVVWWHPEQGDIRFYIDGQLQGKQRKDRDP